MSLVMMCYKPNVERRMCPECGEPTMAMCKRSDFVFVSMSQCFSQMVNLSLFLQP